MRYSAENSASGTTHRIVARHYLLRALVPLGIQIQLEQS